MARDKRGVVLVLALIVTLILSTLLVSFYIQNINENSLARRSVNSLKAFWLAEAGIAQARKIRSSIPLNRDGSLFDSNHTYSARVNRIGSTNYYTITSEGISNGVSRIIEATVEVDIVSGTSSANFQHAIETTADQIITKGANVHINPSDWNDPNGPRVDSDFSFAQLFGISKEEMRSQANNLYTSSSFNPNNVSGITWVDVDSGTTLNITGSSSGEGILVINGNVKFAGTFQFEGIIYVIGKLTATGTFDQFGSLLVESTLEIDPVLSGAAQINYDEIAISSALSVLPGIVTGNTIVSWKE